MSPRTNTNLKIGTLVLILLLVVIIVSQFIHPRPKLVSGSFQSAFSEQNQDDKSSPNLAKIVNQNLADKPGDFAIYIEFISAGAGEPEIYSLRSGESFPAASLYKLYLMAAVLQEVEKGKGKSGSLTMDSEVSASKVHLEEVFGGTDFGYEDAPDQIGYTVEEALTRVARISDNFAAITLAEKIGWGKVQEMADSLGSKNTVIKSPVSTTALDTANFFKLLHQRKLGSENISNQLMEFLSLNQLNNRIPEYLPEDVEVIHKTGELSRVRHDGGVVYIKSQKSKVKSQKLEDKAYVIVMMSQNLKGEDEAVETMAQISKDVYDYFKVKSEK